MAAKKTLDIQKCNEIRVVAMHPESRLRNREGNLVLWFLPSAYSAPSAVLPHPNKKRHKKSPALWC
jgi:hypothetical protein